MQTTILIILGATLQLILGEMGQVGPIKQHRIVTWFGVCAGLVGVNVFFK
jgi:hypothetical protein